MSEFSPPEPLRSLLARLSASARSAGIEAYVVGGTVRDVLLGRPTRDVDLAAAGDARAWARALAADVAAPFVPLDDARGVARVVLADGVTLDVATLQGTLEEDLRRRDFTIDALAVPLGGSRAVDVCGGGADLRAGTVRMTAPSAFDEDPLRLLRAVRIAAELDFVVEPATREAVRARAALLARPAPERRRDELARILALPRAGPPVRLLDELGLLEQLLPELAAGKGVAQPARFHAYDVFEHNLRCLEAMDALLAPVCPTDAPGAALWTPLWRAFGWRDAWLRAHLADGAARGRSRAALLKLAALLHDVAKPATSRVDADGQPHFYGHAGAGAAMARAALLRLRFSRAEAEFVAKLVAEHLRPVQLAQVGAVPTRRALYRFYRALDEALPGVLLLALADGAAAAGPRLTPDGWSRQVAYMNALLVRSMEEEGIVHAPRLLTGHDVMSELGIGGGPEVGRLLAALAEAQAAGEVQGRAEALAYVRRRAREGTGRGR